MLVRHIPYKKQRKVFTLFYEFGQICFIVKTI